MANTSESVAKALLSLSNNVNLFDSRRALIESLTSDQLKDVIVHCMRKLSKSELILVLAISVDRALLAPRRLEVVLELASPLSVRLANDGMTGLKMKVKLFLRVVTSKFGGRPFWYENVRKYPLLQQRLADKISADFESTREDAATLNTLSAARSFAPLSQTVCIGIFLNPAEQVTVCKFRISDNKTGYSCDRCIKQRKLCIRPEKVEGQRFQLVVHPLPKRLRGGRSAESEYYWVRK